MLNPRRSADAKQDKGNALRIESAAHAARPRQPATNVLPKRLCQEQPRLLPVTAHGALRDSKRSGDFVLGHAREVAHFDNLREALVHLLELIQCIVDPDYL